MLFLSFFLSHLKILGEVLKRFVCYYIFSRLGLFLKFNKRRVWNKNILGRNFLQIGRREGGMTIRDLRVTHYQSQLYKLLESGNGAKISDAKWCSAKTKYLDNKK